MLADASRDGLLHRCAMLRENLADRGQDMYDDSPGERLARLRIEASVAGQILVEAVRSGWIRGPRSKDGAAPWLWIALDHVKGRVIEVRFPGWLISCPEPSLILQAIEEIESEVEGREKLLYLLRYSYLPTVVEPFLFRHVALEASRWLLGRAPGISEWSEVVLRLENGEQLRLQVDWRCSEPGAEDVEKLSTGIQQLVEHMEQALEVVEEEATADVADDERTRRAAGDEGRGRDGVADDGDLLNRASEVILRESEDGKELQRIDAACAVLGRLPIENLGEGKATWVKLRSAAVKLQRDHIEKVNHAESLGCDPASIAEFEGAEYRIKEHGRKYGYRPMIELDREASKRFRDHVWAKLAPELRLQPSQLMPENRDTKLRMPIFHVAIWTSDIPNLARHAESARAPRRRRLSAREDAARREREADDDEGE